MDDDRREIKLDVTKATGSVLKTMVDRALREAFESDAARLIIGGFLEGRKLKGDWLVSVKSIGDIVLVPKPAEPMPVEKVRAERQQKAANRRESRNANRIKAALNGNGHVAKEVVAPSKQAAAKARVRAHRDSDNPL